VPAQQSLVEKRGMPRGEAAEVSAIRVGLGVVGDDLHPGPRDRVVVLLRRPRVDGDLLDPVADLRDRLRPAVPPHSQEGQVDVLPVPELPVRPGDLGQDGGQFGVRRSLMLHQQASCKAVMTAW
jgi:hypothetical protein